MAHDCNSSFDGKKCERKNPTYSRLNVNLDNQNTSDFGVDFCLTLSLVSDFAIQDFSSHGITSIFVIAIHHLMGKMWM